MIELNDDDIITRWEMTGLLEDIPDEEKADIAHLLHAAALYVSGDDLDAKISALFIPMIRKIYGLNKCVSIKFKVLELMIESALWWKDHKKPKISFWNKIIAFFVKISLLNLSLPSKKTDDDLKNDVVEQVCKEYVAKFCKHGTAKPTARNFDCGEPLNYCRFCWVSNASKQKCEHGKGMTDYCLPCNRVNNA